MTWHRYPWGALRVPAFVATSLGVAFAAGCDGDDKRALRVANPANDAELSMADDTDSSTPGLQYDVLIESSDMMKSTPVLLFVAGKQVATGALNGSGTVTLKGVTLPPGELPIYAATSTGSVMSDEEQRYAFRLLSITAPMAGTLGADADVDPATPGVQVRVSVAAYGVDDEVTLSVDGEDAGSESVTDEQATFEVTLDSGEHTLVAAAGDLESEPLVVTVGATGCGMVTVVSPVAGDDGVATLGGSDGTCPESGTYTTTVELATAVDEGTSARLYINNATTWVPGEVDADGHVVFDDVPLELRDSENELYVVFDTDTQCREDLDVKISVDCDGPDCSITAPEPFAGVDDNGDNVDYINAAIGADGFDLTVHTTDDAGREVKLLVDGEAVDYDVSDDGDTAVFDVPALSDGPHTFQAECSDGSGNTSATTEKTWVVDLTPCQLTIVSPTDGQALDAADDVNSSVEGIMIQVQTTVAGAGCDAGVDARVSVCDPSMGIDDSELFVAYSEDVALSATIVEMTMAQNVCFDVRDRAGNITSASVEVATLGAPNLRPSVQVDPTSATYRTDPLQLSWLVPDDLDPTYTNYDFRCHVRDLDLTDLSDEDAATATSTWLMEARYHRRADGSSRFVADGVVPTATGTYDMATGSQPLYCVLRVCNDTSECTEVTGTTMLQKPFREVLASSGESGLRNVGESVVPLGDVNGDGLADVLISASTPSAFGDATANSADDNSGSAPRTGVLIYLGGETPLAAPSVVISQAIDADGSTTVENTAPFGYRAAGLGDINGDGLNDFAVSFPADNDDQGVVYVFFGRLGGDAWPAAVDLDGNGCGADICIRPGEAGLIDLGTGLSGVRDFDGDGVNDIAMSAPLAASFAGSIYVLLGDATDVKCSDATCAERTAGDFFGEERTVSAGGTNDFRGFVITHPTGGSFMGGDIIPAGKSEGGGDSTDDFLFVRASGGMGELFRLTGRAYGGGGGLQTIDFSEAAQVMTGLFTYNTRVAVLGDVWMPDGGPASMEGMSDIGVHFNNTSYISVLPGDSAAAAGFSNTEGEVLRITGKGGSNFGASISRSVVPALGWVDGVGTDLDGDASQDICIGGSPAPGAEPAAFVDGEVYYIVGDVLQSMSPLLSAGVPNINAYAVDTNALATSHEITPAGTASDSAQETGVRNVQVVGDMNGDGRPDVVVGDVPQRTASYVESTDPDFDNGGGFWLLY